MAVPGLDIDGVVALNAAIRHAAANAGCMSTAAQRVVETMADAWTYDIAALTRLYVTVRYGKLPREEQSFAAALHGGFLEPEVPCLTLLGTTGADQAWRDRSHSVGHRAIPLASASVVRSQIPMVAGLLEQLDVDVETVIDLTKADAMVLHHREYGIFHVPDARGSALIPAQDFVAQYGISSVVGCGGALPSGEIFTSVLFAREALDKRTAELFRTIAYGIKAALVPYTYRVFA